MTGEIITKHHFAKRAVTFADASSSPFAAGNSPYSLAIADVDGDGKLDLVSANVNGNDLSVLLGTGAGTFGAANNFMTAGAPFSVTIAEVDGDGKLDLVVANENIDSISVLFGYGNGTFAAVSNFAAGDGPIGVAIADVNGDGKLDLVSANRFSDDLSVLLGMGARIFSAASNFAAGDRPTGIAIADVNGDGKLDLVSAEFNIDNLSVLLGNGDGTFDTASSFAVGDGPFSVKIADVNRDGKLDLVTANYNSDNLSVLLGNGNGTFGAASNFAAGNGPYSLAIADVDGDGKLDLVTANYDSDNLSVLLGNGDGTFGAASNFAAGDGPFSVAIADVDSDGQQDLISANYNSNNLSVLINQFVPPCNISIGTTGSVFATGSNPSSIAIADISKDGQLDLVVANIGSDNFSILLGVGDGTFGAPTNLMVGTAPTSVAIADFDKDGNLDVVIANRDSHNLSILLGNGDGTFNLASTYAAGTNPFTVAIADFDRDGNLDLVSSNIATDNLSVFLGQGDGTFDPATNFLVGDAPFTVAIADLDKDGILDLVSSNVNSNNVSILLGNGDGTFAAAATLAAGTYPRWVAIADLNRDGNLDIVTANRDSNNVSIRLGNGDGSFGTMTNFAVGTGPRSVTIADVDGDGKLDLVAANRYSNNASILLGNGDGTFNAATNLAVGLQPFFIAIADVDSNGKLDLISSNTNSNNLSVYLNQLCLTPSSTASPTPSSSITLSASTSPSWITTVIGSPTPSSIFLSNPTLSMTLQTPSLSAISMSRKPLSTTMKSQTTIKKSQSSTNNQNEELEFKNSQLKDNTAQQILANQRCEDLLGYANAKIGDFNGDGLGDYMVGAPGGEPNGIAQAGYVSVVYGQSGFERGEEERTDVKDVRKDLGFIVEGAEAGDMTGFSVSAAGDIDGDGLADIAIGAPYATRLGRKEAGAVTLLWGTKENYGKGIDLKYLTKKQGFTIIGASAGDHAGYSVSSAGDFNADGLSDILIGAPDAGKGGEGYVVYGRKDNFPVQIDLSTLKPNEGIRLIGDKASGRFGVAVSKAGKVSPDEIDDILMGASDANSAYLIYGDKNLSSQLSMDELTAKTGCHLLGEEHKDRFGAALSEAGDINNDGQRDIVIGAPHASPEGRSEAGAVYLVYGDKDLPKELQVGKMSKNQGVILRGDKPCEHTGASVGAMISKEGSDIIIGASDANVGNKINAGKAYIVRGEQSNFRASSCNNIGEPEPLPHNQELSQLSSREGYVIEGTEAGQHTGFSVRGGGDIDGNSQADILISAVEECGKVKLTDCQRKHHVGEISAASRAQTLDLGVNLMLGVVLAKMAVTTYNSITSKFSAWLSPISPEVTQKETANATIKASAENSSKALSARYRWLCQRIDTHLQQPATEKWLRYGIEDMLEEMVRSKDELSESLLGEWEEEFDALLSDYQTPTTAASQSGIFFVSKVGSCTNYSKLYALQSSQSKVEFNNRLSK